MKSILDAAANGVGAALRGAGYGVGRVSPAVEDAASAVAGTKTCQFIGEHFGEGWKRGYNATILAREKRLRRADRASWIKRNFVTPAAELVDAVHEDMRGPNPRMKPEGA
jgi:hypothetical protein